MRVNTVEGKQGACDVLDTVESVLWRGSTHDVN